MADRVPQSRLYMAWTGPKWGTAQAHHLEMARAILAGGKNSRLYKRLVYEDQIATDVAMEGYAFEIAGLEILEASAKDGITLDALEQATREELERFTKDGPTRAELERVKTLARAAFIRGIETVGGPGSKSSVLAENMVYGGDPGLYQQRQDNFANATRDDLRKAVADWVGRPPYVAHIEPYPEFSNTAEGVDRSELPEPGAPVAAAFPAIERATLDNGLKLAVVSRPTVPDVKFNLIVDSGYASDPLEATGKASMAMAMLDEGAGKLDALEISAQLDMLGAELATGVGLDTASVSLAALTENLDAALDLFAQVVLEPSFPAKELERLRGQYLTVIQQEKVTPTSMALRLLPGMLYGKGHAYAQPLTGTGTEESVKALTRDDLIAWHSAWFRPNNATLVVVGDATLESIRPRIEALFADWEAASVPAKNVRMVTPVKDDTLYLIDKPEAEQSIIMAGQLIAPLDNPDEVAIKAMNDLLGGQFSSRINLNLREDKSWSYGARSLIWETRAQRPLLVYAPVQTDKTAPALKEILREFSEIRGSNPPTAAELERVQRSRTLSLPGRWETNAAVTGAVTEIVSNGLPYDYWDGYAERINNLNLEQVSAAATATLNTDELIWVVIGDREKIAAELEAMGVGTIKLIDADGQPVAE
jgi:zinc protease